MKILIAGRGFDSRHRREVGVFELDQAKALLDAGHEVRFAAVDTRSLRRLRPLGCREYELDGISVVYCAIPSGARPAWLAKRAQRRSGEIIWQRLEREAWIPDIVHAHFGTAMLSAARRRGVPTVYTEHLSAANRDVVPDAELEREKSVCALADRVVCVSHPLAERIGRRNGIEARVVHNIVDAAFSAENKRKSENTETFGFVAAGSLIRRKGYDLVMSALAKARDRLSVPLALTSIGEGEERASLTALRDSLGLQECVAFTGPLSRAEMVEQYRRADAFVLASRLETFGVVYIEAMAMGLPVIATACGGPEDFVDDTNGLLVPTENVDSLADAMETMVLGFSRYDRAAIARTARERFSPRTIAGELDAVYRELMEC